MATKKPTQTKKSTKISEQKKEKEDISLHTAYTKLLFLAAGILILSLTFLSGYFFGWNNYSHSQTIKPIHVADTPPAISVNFEITPIPPDTSNWPQYSFTSHFDNFTVKLPDAFVQTNQTNLLTTFQGQGDVITFSSPIAYTPINKKASNYTVDQYNAQYTTLKDTPNSVAITIDFGRENVVANFSGNLSDIFLFRNIVDSMVIHMQVPSYTNDVKSVSTSLASFSYPSTYIADTELADTKNCQGNDESTVLLVSNQARATIDLNTCTTTKAYPIKSVKETIINQEKFLKIYYKDNSLCYLDEKSQAVKNEILYPLKKWTFAPKVGVLKGVPSTLCMQANFTKLGVHTSSGLENDLAFIIASM